MSDNYNMTINTICKIYQSYSTDKSYVYKLCYDLSKVGPKKREWMVIMKKLEDTKTDEDRKGVIRKDYAKFKADKLVVIMIFNIHDLNKGRERIIDKCTCIHEDVKMDVVYQIGRVTKSDEYYTTLEAAYYSGSTIADDYTGTWVHAHDTGEIWCKTKYINGDLVYGESYTPISP